jgi:hypothetical protein
MFVGNNGNVGIGTTSASYRLQTNGDVGVGLNPANAPGAYPAYGNALHFLGGPGGGINFSDNTDQLWISRFNVSTDVSELRVNIGDNPTTPLQSDAFVVGSTGLSGYVPALTVRSTGRIEYSGRTVKYSNTYDKYRIMFGGANDQNWKTIAFVNIGTGLYNAVAFEVTVLDAMTNFGHTADAVKRTYYVSMTRSIATINDPNNAVCKGPTGGSGYLRAVKTATGVYELQVRQPDDWKHIHVEAQVISELGSIVNYVDNLANGSGGTIYTCP